MRLKDGGFENPSAGAWSVSGHPPIGFDPSFVHSGALAMMLHSRRFSGGIGSTPASGDLIQTILPTVVGEQLALSGWLYGGPFFAADTNLRLIVDQVEIESVPMATLPAGWSPHIWPPATALASSAQLHWQLTAPSVLGDSFLWLDDLALAGDEDVAKRSRWLAHQRLVVDLKGINGAAGGYHTDLGGRVFTKYIRPQGSTHPPLPYICAPLVNSRPRLMDHERDAYRHYWTLPIMLFVAEANVGAYDSDAIAVLYHLVEDVYQVLKRDPLLGGTISSMSFLDGGIEEGGLSPFDGLPYADAVIPIELSIVFGLDVLGP